MYLHFLSQKKASHVSRDISNIPHSRSYVGLGVGYHFYNTYILGIERYKKQSRIRHPWVSFGIYICKRVLRP